MPSRRPLVVGMSPFERCDPALVGAICRSGAYGILDLGRDADAARAALDELGSRGREFGVRVPEGVRAPALPETVTAVVLPAGADLEPFDGREIIAVQVTSLEEAEAAVLAGANALWAKGAESGGRVGDTSAFVLLQQLVAHVDVPIWVQGGVGLHTAAACIAGGATGVILDAQLALARESTLPMEVRDAVRAMDGSETVLVGGHRVFTRPDLPIDELAAALPGCLGGDDLRAELIPMGQEAAFARSLATRFVTVGRILSGVRDAISGHLQQAKSLRPLDENGPLARAHGLRVCVAQGPMTRVSDRAQFAEAVAVGGGLPFLALSLFRGPEVRKLLEATRDRLGDRPWGVGILGFVPAELREEQLREIERISPSVALIAGGRPAQARALENKGIPTYLHVPSPGLLDLFLKDGARRFVFEGRECGGHVGPRSSFALWEMQIERLLAFEALDEVSLFFAGGIHDARSAAMVAAMAAPLVARGAKIGVLMGTSYLFTEEAVSSGAILPGYQQAAIDCQQTTLLQTGPGHSTRCVDTQYVRTFEETREKLRREGKDSQEMWAALEQLNLGRLRIAAKGIRREGDALVEVDRDVQEHEGMFMIGQVAALRNEVTTIAALHDEVSVGASLFLDQVETPSIPKAKVRPVDIAIIGMAGFFPGAPDLDRFWSNIVHGRDSITEIPRERWNVDLYYDPDSRDGKHTPSKWGGFLPEIDFDPLDYGIPPRSLPAIEPVQLLALEAARRALEDAGYADRPFDRENASVIFGAEAGTDLAAGYGFRALYPQFFGELPEELDRVLPSLTEDSFPGVLANVIAGRIANRLDLGGVNYTVDAACASSLAALDLGCKELVAGSSDLVLCGGADLHNTINDYLLFASTHALSRKGQCRTFDTSADGIVLGEGVAVVVLKRLEDAEHDGDRIYAVVKAVAGSSDGKSLGLTAPRKEGQMRSLERAYERAGVSPSQVGLVEAHGTGTVVGDRTELGTLTEVYTRAGVAPGTVTLGSVKSNVGHTKCAAGLAGLVKIALALHHRTLPPTLHLTRPNPAWDPEHSPFVFRTRASPWPGDDHHAAVSAFGFGGTNFHAVLAAHDESAARIGGRDLGAELFLFRDRAELDRLSKQLEEGRPALRALAKAVCAGRGPVEVAIVAHDLDELRERVAGARAGVTGRGIHLRQPVAGKVAFVFPGQGSQRPGMLADLFVAFPRLQSRLQLDPDLFDRIFPAAAFDPQTGAAQQAAITDTRVAQPALGIVDLGAADLLEAVGVRPDLLAGHSYGELVALCVGESFSPEDLISLSVARAGAILAAAGDAPGSMAAVKARADLVAAALDGFDDIVIANYNAPRQTVIAGPDDSIALAVEHLETEGLAARTLSVACAFHSPIVAGARDALAERLERMDIQSPSIPVYSNTTTELHQGPDEIRETLAAHVARPVRFLEEIEQMYADGARVFIEVGPGRVLTDLITRILGEQEHLAVPIESGEEDGLTDFLTLLARLATAGLDIDTSVLFEGRDIETVDLEAPALARSATAWRVNGHRAVPVEGSLPEFAMQVVEHPLNTEPRPGTGENDEVMIEYLRGVRELVDSQREVMLSYFGQEPKPRTESRFVTTHAVEASVVESTSAKLDAPARIEARSVAPAEALLTIVSDRTGYPKEMLDLDLDLEADLSIDSIKRVEIIGALTEQLGLSAASEAERDQMVEELAQVKTLRGILGWLHARDAVGAGPAADARPDEAVATGVSSVPPSTLRYVLRVEAAPPLQRNGNALAGSKFAMVEDEGGRVAAALARLLIDSGASVEVLGDEDEVPEVDGLLHLASLDPVQPVGAELFALADRARTVLAARARLVVAATGQGGRFGRPANGRGDGGVAGLIKTIAKEWPDAHVRAVDLDPSEDADRLAAHLFDEIMTRDHLVEVGWKGDSRTVLVAQPEEPNGRTRLELDSESVVLLTGGARGITARIAVAIAGQGAPRMVLIGRTPEPTPEEDSKLRDARDPAALRRRIVELGLADSPAEIEALASRTLVERQMRATFAALNQAGVTFEYHPCDVRDADAFGHLIDDVYDRLGRIDLVVHGAGVNEDKLLRDKTADSFERVYDTKVKSALVLAEHLHDDVQLVVFFSSIAGAFGNRGQADYAAANDALDKLAFALRERIDGRVVSINWGPWAGGGMVTPELEREYNRRGIGLIDPDDGVKRLLDELSIEGDTQVILMRAAPERLA